MDSNLCRLESGSKHDWMGYTVTVAATAFASFIRWFLYRFPNHHRQSSRLRAVAAIVAKLSKQKAPAC
jgi:hypothetical protein